MYTYAYDPPCLRGGAGGHPPPMFLNISAPPSGREAPAMRARRARNERSEPGTCSWGLDRLKTRD